MASGGQNQRNPKTSASEPRQRSSWHRTTSMSDKDDNVSLNSFPNDLRPNNWDFSDWRPGASKDQPKRRKKGNPEWEREQSLTQDSPPPSKRQHATPRSFPRTKITSTTPPSQRQALENLRQAMTFSDQEDGVSNDGERNNERNLLRRRENLPGYRGDLGTNMEQPLTRPVPNRRDDRNNRNNNKQNQNEARAATGKPDSSQIVGRLMQIRDYIKQAGSMMDSLRKSGDPPGYRDEMDRLQKLMDHLKEQERGYTGVLQTLLSVREEPDVNDASREMTPSVEPLDDTRSVDLDVQSEVSEREVRSLSAASRPRIEDKLGLTSDNDMEDEDIEDGVPSETSDNSSTMDDTVISSRKNQEWDHDLGEMELALGGVNNPKEAAETLIALREQQQLLQKLIEQQEQMRALKSRQASLLAMQQEAETKLASTRQKSNEARSLSNALEEAALSMTNRVDSLSAISGAGGGAESNATRQQQTDPELMDIRQQLQYLRNELKSQDQNLQQAQASGRNLQSNRPKDVRPKNQPPPRPPSPKFAERPQNQRDPQLVRDMVPPTDMSKEQLQSRLQELLGKKDRLDRLIQEEFSAPMFPMPTEDMNRDELQNKLRELQDKKSRMDVMLQELQSLRTNPAFLLNNAGASANTAPTPPPSEVDPVIASSEGTENLTNGVLEMLDARQKLQKLNEVKDKLSQLKSLVHFYESTEDATDGRQDVENQSSLPAYSDYSGENEPTRDRVPERDTQQGKPVAKSQAKRPVRAPQPVQESDDESSSSSSSASSDGESESQLSSLGPWGDDPEIQEKVRKLKEAKEKLKHLQNLVAIVQHSPGMADELPDNLAEIAASMEDVESQLTQTDNNNASEGEVPAQADGDAYYQHKMEEQMGELEELKNEKTRLLTIQSQLQSLHDRFQQQEQSAREQDKSPDSRAGTRPKSPTEAPPDSQQQDGGQQQSGGPSVTFSSNDEVYYKMRNQRMLREELRDKKKQLESIMKKDRNKKQYYKNQDNQSDTVSYSTEMFGIGASVDQTMATWGGSTVDNLESITEDGAVQDNDDEEDDDDDAYPIDGILQVEEEEEENQSDNETYTIEDDVRQRRKARAMAKSNNEPNPRKGKRSFPRPSRQNGARPKEAWTGTTDFNKWSRNGRKSRQENYRSAEEIVQDDEDPDTSKTAVEELQRKLEETSMLCQSLLGDSQPMGLLSRQQSAGFGSHNHVNQLDLQQQLQQQQLMMSLNQCYQQISLQQMEMQNMQRQMQSLVYQLSDGDVNESGLSDSRVRSLPSLISPMLPRQSPSLLMPGDAFQFNPVYQHMSPSSNRLLRRSVDADTSTRSDMTDGPERQRRSSRQSGRDSYSQRMKKKSVSPPQLNNALIMRSKTQSVQTFPEAEDEEDDESVGFSPDRESFEEYLARKRRDFFQTNKLQERPQKPPQDTGQKRGSKLKSSSTDIYRPGLSAGISGAGYAEDGRSITSSIQSSLAAVSQANKPESVKEEEDTTELSLFETLRESIYSEVATLISQNENRPHYLIELFRELQLLTTDYLRQRVLYDIKDVVSKYLVEDNSVSAPPPPWLNTASGNFTNTELTPSESNVTSDDEEVKTKLKEKVAANLVAKERQKTAMLLRAGSLKDDKYDYQEQAEITSSVSTPSNSYWESPFNQDSLGETAIHLDKTLEKMREMEKRLGTKSEKVKTTRDQVGTDTGDVSSSAMDQGDESSVNSDSVPYPRIDTEQLDQQIKSIMTEVIPVIKEHMDNMCSPQLLAYIKRLVLSLTRQYDGQEFARFFHRQLGSILQDTLAKYEGRKMRECGEDLLVDMSEVLFNELAFFRLMQDLDDPLIAEKMKKAQALSDSEESTEEVELDKDSENESDTTESSTANASDNQDETRPTQTEEEELGKVRDDEFANEVEVQDAEDKDDDPESPFKGVQIELAPSETKPYTRIGSDEDDESADDESQSNEDPSETAVSINAHRMDSIYTDDNEEDAKRQDGTAEPGDEPINGQPVPVSQQGQDQGKDADQGASSGKAEIHSSTEHMNGDILNGDIEVITMDDLPPSLTVMSSDDLQQKLVEEQQTNSVTAAVLEALDSKDELVGDPQFLKEPDETSC